jgi:hypothetical protein
MSPFGGLGQEYAKLFVAGTFSNLGDGMTLVAGPLLAATLTRDPFYSGGQQNWTTPAMSAFKHSVVGFGTLDMPRQAGGGA